MAGCQRGAAARNLARAGTAEVEPLARARSRGAAIRLDSGVLPVGFSLLEKSVDAFALILAIEQIDESLSFQAQSRASRRALAR